MQAIWGATREILVPEYVLGIEDFFYTKKSEIRKIILRRS